MLRHGISAFQAAGILALQSCFRCCCWNDRLTKYHLTRNIIQQLNNKTMRSDFFGLFIDRILDIYLPESVSIFIDNLMLYRHLYLCWFTGHVEKIWADRWPGGGVRPHNYLIITIESPVVHCQAEPTHKKSRNNIRCNSLARALVILQKPRPSVYELEPLINATVYSVVDGESLSFRPTHVLCHSSFLRAAAGVDITVSFSSDWYICLVWGAWVNGRTLTRNAILTFCEHHASIRTTSWIHLAYFWRIGVCFQKIASALHVARTPLWPWWGMLIHHSTCTPSVDVIWLKMIEGEVSRNEAFLGTYFSTPSSGNDIMSLWIY